MLYIASSGNASRGEAGIGRASKFKEGAHLCLSVSGRHQGRQRSRAVGVAQDEAARNLSRNVLQRTRGGRCHREVAAAQQPHELRDAVAPAMRAPLVFQGERVAARNRAAVDWE